ncbi:ATP-binding cassette domain-containing protein [Novispirillum sp. DQ9]|uniref:ATP-binding cassette domain-containing protein n=1 Tax=Novispirillum sp. DQ9 TaxID=3398612 RepID=UPI003C7AAAC5
MRADPSILPLRLSGVGFRHGGKALLSGVDLTFRPGALTVILGPNGAGKSLLLRLAHGLLDATEGSVSWAHADGRQRHAMVFQRPVLLRRSALRNVTHTLALAGVPRGRRQVEALAALDRVGLRPLADRPARVLSGGEQQRLALARATAGRPEVLFLDEPCAALDPAATKAIEEIVLALHAQGTAIVMTTHDLGQARRLAREVVFLHRGRVVEASPAATFFTAPRSPEAAAFLKGELVW